LTPGCWGSNMMCMGTQLNQYFPADVEHLELAFGLLHTLKESPAQLNVPRGTGLLLEGNQEVTSLFGRLFVISPLSLDQRRVRHREPLALVPGLCVFGGAADQEKEAEHKSYCSGGQHAHLPFGRMGGCVAWHPVPAN
jgi:hypothetical protein